MRKIPRQQQHLFRHGDAYDSLVSRGGPPEGDDPSQVDDPAVGDNHTDDSPHDAPCAAADDVISAERSGYPSGTDPKRGEPWFDALACRWRVKLVDRADKFAREQSADAESGDRRPPPLRKMSMLEAPRELRAVTEQQVLKLDALEAEAPNCHAYIDIVRRSLHACWRAASWAALRPTILTGPPGAGKSRIVRRVADAVGLEMLAIPVSGDPFRITGLGPGWSTSKPGEVAAHFGFLRKNARTANPIMVLDELDKVPGGRMAGSNMGSLVHVWDALLSLLEPETARDFLDEYLAPMPLSAQFISWIMIVNDASVLPETVLSRCQLIHIGTATRDHLPAIVRSSWRQVRRSPVGKLFAPSLSDAVVERLTGADVSPRRMRMILEQSMEFHLMRYFRTATRLPRGPLALSPDDVSDDLLVVKSDLKRGIGFTAEVSP